MGQNIFAALSQAITQLLSTEGSTLWSARQILYQWE